MTNKNECSGCRVNCCRSFIIPYDLVEPKWWEDKGKSQFTMFKKDFITGRFFCDNFDKERKICTDYEDRPIICRNTGENGNWPNKKCLLKKNTKLKIA